MNWETSGISYCAKITIEAYGQTETLYVLGKHHKAEGAIDQEKCDGEAIHATLDDMHAKSQENR